MSLSISCVVPVYNEEEHIKKQIEYLEDKMSSYFDDYELILVDDGSTDKSGDYINEIAKQKTCVRTLHNGINLNMGVSVQRGFKVAKKEYVTYNAVDLPFNPVEYFPLIKYMEKEQISMLVVERRKYLGTSIWRKMTSAINRGVMTIMFPSLKKGISDLNYLFIVKREYVDRIMPFARSPIFTWPEMIFRARLEGLKVETKTMTYKPRVVRKGAFGKPHDIIWGIYDMIRFRIRLWKRDI